jgi:hypothetical protein
MQKVAACCGPDFRVIQALAVDHVTNHSREMRGTNEHATMLASRRHRKFLFRDGQKSVHCACQGGVIGAEAREPVSNGQVCIRARCANGLSPFSRLSAPSNTAIPPEFPVRSAHIYGDSVRNRSGSGAARIVRKVRSYF